MKQKPKSKLLIDDRVIATSGHFQGKRGQVVRLHSDQACVVWKGVWDHGIWVDQTELRKTKRYRKEASL